MSICKTCGGDNEEGVEFCVECGTSMTGTPVSTNGQSSNDQPSKPIYQAPTTFGEQSYQQETQPVNKPQPVGGAITSETSPIPRGYQQKSRIAAGLLGIFFGGIGIGRFYLGYVGLGIAQILVTVFTMGIGAIWGFVDGILILCGKVKVDKCGIPLKD